VACATTELLRCILWAMWGLVVCSRRSSRVGIAAGWETFSGEMTQGHQQYRVLERLAAGGMAEVFLAERVGLEGFKKRVAIKRVLPHLSQKTRFIAMFLDEARVSAYLTHSNVAQVFDIGVGENAYFIVMEYVEGADLKSVMEFMRKTGRSFPGSAMRSGSCPPWSCGCPTAPSTTMSSTGSPRPSCGSCCRCKRCPTEPTPRRRRRGRNPP